MYLTADARGRSGAFAVRIAGGLSLLSVVLFGSGALKSGVPSSAPGPRASPGAGACGCTGNARTPFQVAQLLDCIAQPRFQTMNGVFGISRMFTIGGHPGVAAFEPQNPRERDLKERADSSGFEYAAAFLHCAHAPGQYRSGRVPFPFTGRSSAPPPVVVGHDFKPWIGFLFSSSPNPCRRTPRGPRFTARRHGMIAGQDDRNAPWLAFPNGKVDGGGIPRWERMAPSLKTAAVRALHRLLKGENAEDNVGRWLVVMRPVRALQPGCLGCHTTARQGDTLGAMVYLVANRSAGPASQRQRG